MAINNPDQESLLGVRYECFTCKQKGPTYIYQKDNPSGTLAAHQQAKEDGDNHAKAPEGAIEDRHSVGYYQSPMPRRS